jgi:hypothetical protein
MSNKKRLAEDAQGMRDTMLGQEFAFGNRNKKLSLAELSGSDEHLQELIKPYLEEVAKINKIKITESYEFDIEQITTPEVFKKVLDAEAKQAKSK